MIVVPDFRSSHGLFKTLRKDHKLKTSGKDLFDASVYQDSSMTSSFHDMVRSLSGMAAEAQPTAFHHLLARLAKEKRLLRLYTQNVDGIDTSLPPLRTEIPLEVKGPWPKTIQLHGGLEKMVCQKCRFTTNLEPELFCGPDPPLCRACCEIDEVRTTTGQRSRGVGKLRPRMVLYNEHNPDEEAIGAVVRGDLRARPDALIVVGTTMKIPGVRRIVKEMSRVVRGRRDGGVVMWINRDPVPVGKDFDRCWDLVIKGDSDEVARQVGMKNWDDDSDNVFECTTSEVERLKRLNGGVSVVVPAPGIPPEGPNTVQSQQFDPLLAPSDQLPSLEMPQNNPASKGRQITDILSGKPKKPTRQPAPKRPSKKNRSQAATAQPQIGNNFRVTKSIKADGGKKAKPPALAEGFSEAMRTISPGEPRNNGPILPAPNTASSIHLPSSPPWKDEKITVPKPRFPHDTVNLLS